jgi:hypothetical protein
MKSGNGGGDLLYGGHADVISVFSYPRGRFVADLVLPNQANVLALCSDRHGNVFVAGVDVTEGYIFEYAHGRTIPKATIGGSFLPLSCAVDPTSGNLAVANYYAPGAGNVAVYAGARGTPTFYSDPSFYFYNSLTYDSRGNLFVLSALDRQVYLAELSRGSSTFTNLSIPGALQRPSAVIWDGQYLATILAKNRARPKVLRLKVSGGVATVVGVTTFRDLGKHRGFSFDILSKRLVMTTSHDKQGQTMGIFKYPLGGKPQAQFPTNGHAVGPFTISVPPSR